jgi:hypothetical protein
VIRKTCRTSYAGQNRMLCCLQPWRITRAIESTDAYRCPVWSPLEEHSFRRLPVKGAQVKAYRRTADWMPVLPPAGDSEFRNLLRHRVSMPEMRTRVHNQIPDFGGCRTATSSKP